MNQTQFAEYVAETYGPEVRDIWLDRIQPFADVDSNGHWHPVLDKILEEVEEENSVLGKTAFAGRSFTST